jgi:hypothetical protein
MPNYQICDYCGNLYEKKPRNMCKTCENNYHTIFDLVSGNPRLMVLDISHQTGISVSRILSFVEKGFFVMIEGTVKGSIDK